MKSSVWQFCRRFYRQHPYAVRFSLFWWGLFLLLAGIGITGSSLGWYRQYPGTGGVMDLQGERKLFGVYRGIRGDEFIAHGTPNALAQFHAAPQFPRINHNLGLSGRDLLLLHDSGAPVAHPAILGKPAVWGFWLGDLRRALSWYWLFPLFFAIWSMFLLSRVLWEKVHPFWHILLSLTGFLAPLPAAWSFWPAGYAGGLLLATALATAILRGKLSTGAAIPAGIAAGWGATVSALMLYFPGIWPIAVLMLFITAGLAVQEKNHLAARKTALSLFLTAALLVCGGFLCCYYLAVQDVLLIMADSVYPGRRRNFGGEMEWWMMMRGFLAPLTIYKLDFLNQSEMQHAQLLILPLFLLCFFQRVLRKDRLFISTGLFLIFTLIYQHISFPGFLAVATGFDRCTAARCAMAQHLAQLFMLGAILQNPGEKQLSLPRAIPITAGITFLTGAILFTAPDALWSGLRAWHPAWRLGTILAAIALVYAGTVFCLFRNRNIAILLFTVSGLLPGLIFNPVCLAPTKVENRLPAHLNNASTPEGKGKILFATGNDFLAVAAYLAGNRVLNGYFMYMDQEIQKRLFSGCPNPTEFHRMNHLDAELTSLSGCDFRAEVTHPERIKLTFDPEKYDFRQLPADFLAAPAEQRVLLKKNRSVKLLSSADRIDYWQICHQPSLTGSPVSAER